MAVIPTAVIGPLTISLGEYELTEPEGKLVETRPRRREEVYVPLAHTEGGLVGLALPRRAGGGRVGRVPHLRACATG